MTVSPAALAEMIGAHLVEASGPEATITSVVNDSRQVEPGSLFCCVPGATFDGHRFAQTAADAGAVALLCQHELPVEIAQLIVPSVRQAMGPAAAAIYHRPSERLDVVGVTGTNGKTTVVALLGGIGRGVGRTVAEIGTLHGERTTPEAPELQARLAGALKQGAQLAAIEVSSHALDQGRVDGTHFAVAAFTNLGRDHLDYHQDLEAYFEAKARLFEPGRARTAVVCVDDPYGRRLADGLDQRGDITLLTYQLTDAVDLRFDGATSRFTVDGVEVQLNLAGEHNVGNALAALRSAQAIGIDLEAAAMAIASIDPPPGRFQPVSNTVDRLVVVDYAHTPDALEVALVAARRAAADRGEVIVVFGCGGDRDQGKRPEMGRVAEAGAELVIVTNDNPRSEEPASIVSEILAGMERPSDAVVTLDRAEAIEHGIRRAKPGDVVLLAGKGHERTQTSAEGTIPFDDYEVAESVLAAMASAGSSGDRP